MDDHDSPEYWEIIRKMTPGQKLNAAMQLYYSAKALKRAAVKAQHPEYTEEEVEKVVKEAFMYATD